MINRELIFEWNDINLQISSVGNEKNMLNETNQNLKKELQSLIFDLEEKLKEQQKIEGSLRSEVETLKVQVAEKYALQSQLEEIEEKLAQTESRLNEEVRTESSWFL